jgi:NTP pyrophosphatase (non-canonical NTP hydrolase)
MGNDIDTIANHYGLTAQLDQTVEECAELIQAINKYKRNPSRLSHIEHIAEEMADVKIMVAQLEILLDNETEVREVLHQKVDRQLRRIANER